MLGQNITSELVVKIIGDATNLQNALNQTATKIGSFGKQVATIGRNMSLIGIGISTAVIGTYKAYADYEEKLVDMAKVTDQSFKEIEDNIRGIDPILGNSTQLMEGYYQVISAGAKDPIEALNLLTTAAETAKAAHVEQSEVVKGITKMMAGYEGAIKSASEAADLLFSIEKEGQTTVGELIPVIGGLAKMSSDLNIEQEKMAASLAVITKTAGNTSEATNQFQSVLIGMMKPTESMTEALAQMGYESADLAIKEMGFVEVLKKLEEYTGGSAQALADLFGRKEAMLGFSALGAEGFKTLNDTIVSVGEGIGGAKKAFLEWSETGQAAMDGLKSSLSNLSITVGENFAPMITEMVNKISDIVVKIAEWAKANPALVETVGKIGLVLAVGGPILMGLGFLATAITTLLSPIGLVVIAVAGLATAWATNFLGIRDITKSVIDFVKSVFDKLVKFISDSFERLKKVIDFIKKAVAGIGKVVIEGAIVGPTTPEGFGIGGTSIPSHQTGIGYVPRTGLALLHQGEGVLNPEQNKAYQAGAKSLTININNPVVRNDSDISKIKQQVGIAFEEFIRQYGRKGFEMSY